jgi:hypothetical protein
MTEKITLTTKRYSITVEERSERFTQQSGKCIICTVRPATDVDHNHNTGEVRAILCHGCNVLLGRVDENIGHLRELANRHPLRAPRYLRAANYLLAFGRDSRRAA